jgi:hypothetical protein
MREIYTNCCCSKRDQTGCFKATKGLRHAASSELASLAMAPLLVLQRLRYCCDLKACSLMAATLNVYTDTLSMGRNIETSVS